MTVKASVDLTSLAASSMVTAGWNRRRPVMDMDDVKHILSLHDKKKAAIYVSQLQGSMEDLAEELDDDDLKDMKETLQKEDDLQEIVGRYREVLEQLDEPFPRPFILDDVLNE